MSDTTIGARSPITALKINNMSEPPFKLTSILGKGEGMVAVRDIGYGELILQERPILTENEKFAYLTNDEQKSVMALHDAHKKGGKKTLRGIYDTNSCALCNCESGLFIISSKFNHSCLPNIAAMYVKPYLRLYVTIKIKEGDELCFCYSDKFKGYTERQRNLSLKWRFTCHCELCEMSPSERNKVETARIVYKELKSKLKNCDDFSKTVLDFYIGYCLTCFCLYPF